MFIAFLMLYKKLGFLNSLMYCYILKKLTIYILLLLVDLQQLLPGNL
jgi:hypothetical protein